MKGEYGYLKHAALSMGRALAFLGGIVLIVLGMVWACTRLL